MNDAATLHALMHRWATGLRLLAAAWFVLLMHAWLHRHIGVADVVLFGALPGAVYWTVGRALIRWRRGHGRPLAGRH
jgi:hypothetical protein